MGERYDRIRRIRREHRRERRKQRTPGKTIKNIFGWVITVLTAAILGYGFVAFAFQKIYMVGPSMTPSMSDGKEYVVNKLVYKLGTPERYDVVAFRAAGQQDEYYSVKRVIGLPGETVLIQNGEVYINGNPLPDCPIDAYINTPGIAETSITIGEGEYFLLGDNVNNSQDSRYPNVGNVKESEMLGRIKIN